MNKRANNLYTLSTVLSALLVSVSFPFYIWAKLPERTESASVSSYMILVSLIVYAEPAIIALLLFCKSFFRKDVPIKSHLTADIAALVLMLISITGTIFWIGKPIAAVLDSAGMLMVVFVFSAMSLLADIIKQSRTKNQK
jgi:hypothetical protein